LEELFKLFAKTFIWVEELCLLAQIFRMFCSTTYVQSERPNTKLQ